MPATRRFALSSSDSCATCGATIGRAGRSNEEVVAAHERGEFRTALGLTDYSTDPPTTVYYCPPCWKVLDD